jgi:dephospho-CoA kinase
MPPPEAGVRSGPALIGLTGAIAAGKSEALTVLAALGAATLSSDAVVHDLLDEPEVRAWLVERWGDEVAPDGRVDRNRVGARVFSNPEELAWLESTLHPLVSERVATWVVGLAPHTSVAVVEVPLLFETGLENTFDATIAVVADDRARAERAGARGTDLLEGRSGRQLTQREKAARATFVVRNDGSLDDLRTGLSELWPRLENVRREAE